ncbi:hypothetical protein Q5P01_016798 [Channa striata]|uniref:AIG1-type G domain-containing protein n=1 Tax=Channa striata TaxID=64152 RepID=A0AA88SAU0_CHASR|nr:hypothetical protein Q5P01_016798 [Channa striata]
MVCVADSVLELLGNRESQKSELRVVLLGKTRDGKSTSGTAILGRLNDPAFEAKPGPSSVTNECKTERREIDGQILAVVDTPGLIHTRMKGGELAKAILAFVPEVQPGPHVLLLVLKLGDPDGNEKLLQIFQRVFKGAEGHTIVLFTHGDKYKVDEYLKRYPDLEKLVRESSVGYHVFDNKTVIDAQVTGLIENIKEVGKNGYYPNEKFEKIEKALKKEMKISEETNAESRVKKGGLRGSGGRSETGNGSRLKVGQEVDDGGRIPPEVDLKVNSDDRNPPEVELKAGINLDDRTSWQKRHGTEQEGGDDGKNPPEVELGASLDSYNRASY